MKFLFKLRWFFIWILIRPEKKELPQVLIEPVGFNRKRPTGFDLYVKGVSGGYCGYAKSMLEAEARKNGIEKIIHYTYALGKYHGINKSQNLHH